MGRGRWRHGGDGGSKYFVGGAHAKRMDLIHTSVEKVRIDLKTGFVLRHPVASRNLDFAVINPKYVGKKNRPRVLRWGAFNFSVAKEPNNPKTEEDDGYVVTYVLNENTGESRVLVMDAKSPNLDTVTVVKLPRRVPYGFHGLFVTETDLKKL
ncbi:hypothetical protein RHSIM_RhsimUnG0095600 [Rhododendron simsii]|uniref:Uncharacterized protein n=1 Tax=Rhododendron simsii TaxID=118357 RepID=A0A834FV21_RHOSS|nr:hypothetical protein RHSIM_RhsimUnG0095600 [Rhododendron simsii]